MVWVQSAILCDGGFSPINQLVLHLQGRIQPFHSLHNRSPHHCNVKCNMHYIKDMRWIGEWNIISAWNQKWSLVMKRPVSARDIGFRIVHILRMLDLAVIILLLPTILLIYIIKIRVRYMQLVFRWLKRLSHYSPFCFQVSFLLSVVF